MILMLAMSSVSKVAYELVQVFTLICRLASPHFVVLQNSPKRGKTLYLNAAKVTGSRMIQKKIRFINIFTNRHLTKQMNIVEDWT